MSKPEKIDHFEMLLAAEEFRRKHCDNKSLKDHQCQGTIVIRPALMCLSCPLCGNAKGSTELAQKYLDGEYIQCR